MFRLSVKNLLIVSALFIAAGSTAFWVYRSEKQKTAVRYIEEKGGFVRYDFQFRPDGTFSYQSKPNNTPGFLIDWLGFDYFANVQTIYVPYSVKNTDPFPSGWISSRVPFNPNQPAKKEVNNLFDFEKISSLSNTEELICDPLPVNLNVLSSFQKMKRLSLTTLSHIPEQEDGSEEECFLTKMKSLETLRLPYCWEEILSQYKFPVKLKHLIFSDQPGRLFDIGIVQSQLNKDPKIWKKTVKNLSRLVNLETLEMSKPSIPDLKAFASLERLKHLKLRYVDKADFRDLYRQRELESIEMDADNPLGLSQLKNFSKLRLLYLRNSKLGNGHNLQIPNTLLVLDLQNTRTTSIEFITNKSQLKKINLNGNKITNFSPLENLSNLQILLADHSRIAELKLHTDLITVNHIDSPESDKELAGLNVKLFSTPYRNDFPNSRSRRAFW